MVRSGLVDSTYDIVLGKMPWVIEYCGSTLSQILQMHTEGMLGLDRRLLQEDNTETSLVGAVLIISHIARLRAEYYKPLIESDLCARLHGLLSHAAAYVRARTCSLVSHLHHS